MTSHERSTDLLDATMSTLEGDIANATPQSGTGIIDEWLEQLRKADNTADIADSLEQVKNQLKSGQINESELAQLLTDLSTKTQDLSTQLGPEGDVATRLVALSSALQTAAGQLRNH